MFAFEMKGLNFLYAAQGIRMDTVKLKWRIYTLLTIYDLSAMHNLKIYCRHYTVSVPKNHFSLSLRETPKVYA